MLWLSTYSLKPTCLHKCRICYIIFAAIVNNPGTLDLKINHTDKKDWILKECFSSMMSEIADRWTYLSGNWLPIPHKHKCKLVSTSCNWMAVSSGMVNGRGYCVLQFDALWTFFLFELNDIIGYIIIGDGVSWMVTELLPHHQSFFGHTLPSCLSTKHHFYFIQRTATSTKTTTKIRTHVRMKTRWNSSTCEDTLLVVIDSVVSSIKWFLCPQESCNLVLQKFLSHWRCAITFNLSTFAWIRLDKCNGLHYWQISPQTDVLHSVFWCQSYVLNHVMISRIYERVLFVNYHIAEKFIQHNKKIFSWKTDTELYV